VKKANAGPPDVDMRSRFAFGENWQAFLAEIDEERIQLAMESIRKLFKGTDLSGKRLIDVGSGSGLMSLAARKLGMEVLSFDYDHESVACTRVLKEKYFPNDKGWTIHQGSVLDKDFISRLGTFDYVYSWGVLHHTGDLWHALDNVVILVAEGGYVALALYNDQGVWSKLWSVIKRIYNKLPSGLRTPFAVLVMAPRELKIMAIPLLRGRFKFIGELWSAYPIRSGRGMSRWRDMVDWVGGYPFEVSKPEQIFYFLRARHFHLIELATCGGELGCNEYVFQKKRSLA
jgi:2-polyprenyl-3-methyl-5-hydroxy-6-metoxy-1,4-benzoquinol methylase